MRGNKRQRKKRGNPSYVNLTPEKGGLGYVNHKLYMVKSLYADRVILFNVYEDNILKISLKSWFKCTSGKVVLLDEAGAMINPEAYKKSFELYKKALEICAPERFDKLVGGNN